jgi:alpha-glucosidase
MLGGSLLVAAVAREGRTTRYVYLPRGSWVDFHTGEVYEGHQFITAAAPLSRTPVFIKGGAVIPMLPQAPQSTMDLRPEALELLAYIPKEDGEFVSSLREDDGLTIAHERGAFLQTTFRMERKGDKVKLTGTASGDGFSEFSRVTFRLVFKGEPVSQVRINGELRDAPHGRVDFRNQGEAFAAEILIG